MDKLNVLTALVAVMLFLSVVNFYGTYKVASALNDLGTGAAVVPTGNNEPTVPAEKVDAEVGNGAVLGDEDAPVTIIEFSDFQCPFCRKFWTETFGQIKQNYVDTGKVKFVYRHFPLEGLHPAANIAGQAAECVRELGGDEAFWKMHDKIYMEQNILDSGSATGAVTKTVTFGAADLKKWAKDLGYDVGACLDSGKYKGAVDADTAEGASYGVQGTPAFFVNGNMLSGAYPYASFQQLIEAELN